MAEFAADEELVQFLRTQGVDYAQGFHIGRPLPVAEALAAACSANAERRGSREVDRRLDGLPRAHVVDVAAPAAGECTVAAGVAVAALVEELTEAVGEQTLVVRPVDHRADERLPRDEVGDDMLRAARVVAADADHQRRAPGVGAEGPVALPGTEAVEPAAAGEPVVQRGGRGEAERVRRRVEVVVGDGRAEGIAAGGAAGSAQLRPDVRDQRSGRGSGADRLRMRERARVVEVERVLAGTRGGGLTGA